MTTQETGEGPSVPRGVGWGARLADTAAQWFLSERQLLNPPRGTRWMPSFLPCSTRISHLCLYSAYA